MAEDYIHIHRFFDETKNHHGDYRHRALRHHTLGVAECVERFGDFLVNSGGRKIPTRWIAEQHVVEDHGYIPSLADWLTQMKPARWMTNSRSLSRELAVEKTEGEQATHDG